MQNTIIAFSKTNTNKVDANQAIARIKELSAERAAIEFAYMSAKDEAKDYGMYGQLPERINCEIEHNGYLLQLWDEDNGEELKELVAKFGKHIKVPMHQRV